eukprot:TRINITY_DN5100_c0_g2_i1.p1 TRINITY_DN5100_c0_g2~~TRINITY_DN5100_c0_g2_i1.p1  ORF type:complete len:101 (+),score=7.66 TRINITY_DN5100_c0_g2_i1:352-654(+)
MSWTTSKLSLATCHGVSQHDGCWYLPSVNKLPRQFHVAVHRLQIHHTIICPWLVLFAEVNNIIIPLDEAPRQARDSGGMVVVVKDFYCFQMTKLYQTGAT